MGKEWNPPKVFGYVSDYINYLVENNLQEDPLGLYLTEQTSQDSFLTPTVDKQGVCILCFSAPDIGVLKSILLKQLLV